MPLLRAVSDFAMMNSAAGSESQNSVTFRSAMPIRVRAVVARTSSWLKSPLARYVLTSLLLAEQPKEKRDDERHEPQILAPTYAQDEPRGDNETGDPLQFVRSFIR